MPKVQGQVQGPYSGSWRLSYPGHNGVICNPYPGIRSGDVGTFDIMVDLSKRGCSITLLGQTVRPGPAYPRVRNPVINHAAPVRPPDPGPVVYPQESSMSVIIARPAGGFSLPSLPSSPFTGGTTTGPTSPTLPTGGGGTPTNPWQPIINQGCSHLPSWAQAACNAAGGIITGSGQPGPGTNNPVPGTTDPTPGTVTPGEASMGAVGLQAPMLMNVNRLKCPGGGVVHYYPNTAQYDATGRMVNATFVCLPRGVSGAKFGLVRKNKPRPKPYISAAEVKALRKIDALTKKAKKFASMTGQTCRKSGR